MLIKLMRHFASHKKVIKLDVNPLSIESLEQALDTLNNEYLPTIQTTYDLAYQGKDRCKLLRLEFCYQGKLLSLHHSLWKGDSSNVQQIGNYIKKLDIDTKKYDYGTSEFIFICYALQHERLHDKVIAFIDKLTVYSSRSEYAPLQYPDLSPLGAWAALAVAIKIPNEIDSVVSFFNEYSTSKTGLYFSYNLMPLLIQTYNLIDDQKAFLTLYCSQISSYLWVTPKHWEKFQHIINPDKFLDQQELKMTLNSELTRWTNSLPLGEHEDYVQTFINPILNDEDDRKEIRYLLEKAQRQAAFR